MTHRRYYQPFKRGPWVAIYLCVLLVLVVDCSTTTAADVKQVPRPQPVVVPRQPVIDQAPSLSAINFKRWPNVDNIITSQSNDLFVATTGSDTNSATQDAPLASLEAARDTVRKLKHTGPLPVGGLTVWIRQGTYWRTNCFELTEIDSGSPESPVVYRAWPRERVILTGGKPVAQFAAVTDPEILKRLDLPARRAVVQSDLKTQGFFDLGELTVRAYSSGRNTTLPPAELFFGGKRMQLPRWPHEGWAQISATVPGQEMTAFRYDGERPARWLSEPDVWLHGYWNQNFGDGYQELSMVDTNTHQIKMVPSEMFFTNPSGPFRYTAGSRYYALNILAELAQPGDYYIDRSKRMLYFFPPAPITSAQTWLSSLRVNLIRLRNTSHVIIQGITFEGTRTDAIVIQGGSQNIVGGCIIRNIGQYGVKIQDGTTNGVDGCDMYNLGEGGIRIVSGDTKTLTPANNYANNNHIHHYACIIRTYQPAIKIIGVGNQAAHNLIHDAPQQGLLFEGNDHVIEFNEFYNLLYEINDNGVIYTGGNLTDQGTIIRYNLFHDIQYGYQRFSVYLDDYNSGTTVLGNIFWNASVGVMLNGGNDNLIVNNLFLDCRFPCVIRPPNRSWKLLEGLRTVNPTQPPYSTRYPRMAKLLTEDIPNEFISNVAWPNKEPLPQSEFAGNTTNYFKTSKNLVGIDPRVLNPAGFSFQLGKQSPAFSCGFEQIPFERIGLYRDAYRPRFSLDK